MGQSRIDILEEIDRNDIVEDEKKLSLLFDLPPEVTFAIPSMLKQPEATQVISGISQTCKYFNAFFKPLFLKGALSKALYHAAYAREQDVEKLLAMLVLNPSLLLEKGNVVTPGGDELQNITIYEVLLGSGDSDFALKVEPYFGKIAHGKEEQVRQFERYRTCIENLPDQLAYDISGLIEIIKKADYEAVLAIFKEDMSIESELKDAILKFRKDHAPRIISEPCIHYNYASLEGSLITLEQEWDNLYNASGNNYQKIRLFWWKIIGFLMRRLPGVDRCILAQGIHNIVRGKKPFIRSYKYNQEDTEGEFPITLSDKELKGPGNNYAINIVGKPCGTIPRLSSRRGFAQGIRKLKENKKIGMLALEGAKKPIQCVIC